MTIIEYYEAHKDDPPQEDGSRPVKVNHPFKGEMLMCLADVEFFLEFPFRAPSDDWKTWEVIPQPTS